MKLCTVPIIFLLLSAGSLQEADGAIWAKARPKSAFDLDNPLRSPDGRLEIIWKKPPDADWNKDWDRELWIRRVGEPGWGKVLYSFPRSADVLWSPDGTMVAITDEWGSNGSSIVILRVHPDEPPREIQGVTRKIERLLAPFGHAYAYADCWSADSRRLRVRLRAHGALDGSARTLEKVTVIAIPAAKN
jgi:hypothetical protein